MINRVINSSIDNRFLVFVAAALITAIGVWAIKNAPIDALPDLSDTQVIVQTSYEGQAPRIVEDQITYPLSTLLMGAPRAKTVRGFSAFGESFIYVIFEDGTDPYWARSRVLEYLNQVKLPNGVTPKIGPDATGVGWVYEYALIDKSGKLDLSELRDLQDWFLGYELRAVSGVAEVASVGGAVKEFQIVVDPVKLQQYGVEFGAIKEALSQSNSETGGGAIEIAEAEYMTLSSGYLKTIADFERILLRGDPSGASVYLKDVARIQIGAKARRGVTELNGEGETVGAIVVMRSGANAKDTIAAVKTRLNELKPSLPNGVEIVETYDRSALIDRAIANLTAKLIEEFLVVALVCAVFLRHLRSAFVAIVSLPLGVFISFIVMSFQGINANIMSLGGVAITIGAMIDAAVVMVENAHKVLERKRREGVKIDEVERVKLIASAASEVGGALFISLLIITLSFIPIFTLQGEEGRLFSPLAFTKTYAMAGAAILAITVIPVLMIYLIRGKIPNENDNGLNRFLIKAYRPALNLALAHPKTTIAIAFIALGATIYPIKHIGGEFLPRIAEGDLLYMPSTLPSVSSAQATKLLQNSDRLIKTIPEVDTVFGKAGRAETATDPAPMSMIETAIKLKPKEEWREGVTLNDIIRELDDRVRFPGVANLWAQPIRSRIDMLSTGVKSPIGIKVSGQDLETIDKAAERFAAIAREVEGVTSALAEKLTGGRYINIDFDRENLARYDMTIAKAQEIVSSAIGGKIVGEVVDGTRRRPINIRLPQSYRGSVSALKDMPVITPNGRLITLSDIANITVGAGAPMLKSENARLSAWVYIDVRGRDLASVVEDIRSKIADRVDMTGVSASFAGQFELLQRANERLSTMIPFTLAIIFVLLFTAFKRFDEAALIMCVVPFALIGGFWLLYLAGWNFSAAVGAGFIALAGLAAEFGVVMLIYLKSAVKNSPRLVADAESLDEALRYGAVQRVRPKAMTVTVIIAGLLPIMFGDGAGSEVMSRIAAPMVGGMISAPLLSMFVVPAAYKLLLLKRMKIKNPS
ncbi:MAG: CusA/CzcA family heavy metal efflux RND transporter [Helicobacteraceae bacterium]|jgi:Cu(I)/Ag(I) efflux system membrane protein CusA/SilA|nr:CusA/CzcA family heavy metal efflux RND transporter [Helicobacteraceae bacterium]